jgi:glyoxylase I family protein
MSQVLGLDHVSLIVSDADRASAFYQKVLGLGEVDRPDLGFPGYWLNLGSGQTLHLMQLPNPYQNATRPGHGGRDVHFALRVASLDFYKQALAQHNVDYRVSQSGRNALFFRDLDANVVELTEV